MATYIVCFLFGMLCMFFLLMAFICLMAGSNELNRPPSKEEWKAGKRQRLWPLISRLRKRSTNQSCQSVESFLSTILHSQKKGILIVIVTQIFHIVTHLFLPMYVACAIICNNRRQDPI